MIIKLEKARLKRAKWQYQQEMNLKYVAVTRAKHELVFDHKWTDEEGDDIDNIEE